MNTGRSQNNDEHNKPTPEPMPVDKPVKRLNLKPDASEAPIEETCTDNQDEDQVAGTAAAHNTPDIPEPDSSEKMPASLIDTISAPTTSPEPIPAPTTSSLLAHLDKPPVSSDKADVDIPSTPEPDQLDKKVETDEHIAVSIETPTRDTDAPATPIASPFKRDPNKSDTAVLATNQIQRRAGQSKGAYGTVSFGQHELILVVRGMVERLMISEGKKVVLGRSNPKTRFHPDVDLTPYGALDRGVSREHASLHAEDGRLYVTDLGSTNGTFLGGKQLEAHKPTLIGKGDELLLGRLAVQVMFR